MRRGTYTHAVIKSSTPDTRIYYVFAWLGGRLQRVFLTLPGKFQGILLFTETDGEVADGKRLDYVLLAVLAAYILQNGFIECASDGKLEVGVMSQPHIREVLV